MLHRFVGGPVAALLLGATAAVHAQTAADSGTTARAAMAVGHDSVRPSSHYWSYFAAGFASSILLHEAGHIGMSLALGAHPTFGFNKGRPTVYSGISAESEPHK